MTLRQTLGLELPIIQAPMAGVQDAPLAIAVSEAGALGSLPCAMLGLDAMREQLQAIRSETGKPFNVNFFCHRPPQPDVQREANWRAVLAPYYREFGIDAAAIKSGPGRLPFSAEAAALLGEFRPPVVSFQFGLPEPALLQHVRRWGARVISSATTVQEDLWLQAQGVDAVIAQGLEASGHRGMFLSSLKAGMTRLRLARRLEKAQSGNVGDVRSVGTGVWEMREFFEPGWRMYYIQRGQTLLVMLGGGDKSTQDADIAKAQALVAQLEN